MSGFKIVQDKDWQKPVIEILQGVFLDALASLGLMIVPDSFTDWKLTVPQIPQIPQISSLKMECHSKQNVTQNGMSLKMECHSK